jgi:hypothetical protein
VPQHERSREKFREVVGMVKRGLDTDGGWEITVLFRHCGRNLRLAKRLDTEGHKWTQIHKGGHELHQWPRMDCIE